MGRETATNRHADRQINKFKVFTIVLTEVSVDLFKDVKEDTFFYFYFFLNSFPVESNDPRRSDVVGVEGVGGGGELGCLSG